MYTNPTLLYILIFPTLLTAYFDFSVPKQNIKPGGEIIWEQHHYYLNSLTRLTLVFNGLIKTKCGDVLSFENVPITNIVTEKRLWKNEEVSATASDVETTTDAEFKSALKRNPRLKEASIKIKGENQVFEYLDIEGTALRVEKIKLLLSLKLMVKLCYFPSCFS